MFYNTGQENRHYWAREREREREEQDSSVRRNKRERQRQMDERTRSRQIHFFCWIKTTFLCRKMFSSDLNWHFTFGIFKLAFERYRMTFENAFPRQKKKWQKCEMSDFMTKLIFGNNKLSSVSIAGNGDGRQLQVRARVVTQCDQTGQFWKFLTADFLTKAGQIFMTFWVL